MKISKDEIKNLNPCADGYKWYLENREEDLLSLLLRLNQFNSTWASWLFSRRMNLTQRRAIAIFAAEQVLHLFEEKFPTDSRPRLAIEAAKKVISPNAAAYAAAYAASAAYAAAAYAAADAAAAYAAAAAAKKEMQERIIKEAVRILDAGEHL